MSIHKHHHAQGGSNLLDEEHLLTTEGLLDGLVTPPNGTISWDVSKRSPHHLVPLLMPSSPFPGNTSNLFPPPLHPKGPSNWQPDPWEPTATYQIGMGMQKQHRTQDDSNCWWQFYRPHCDIVDRRLTLHLQGHPESRPHPKRPQLFSRIQVSLSRAMLCIQALLGVLIESFFV